MTSWAETYPNKFARVIAAGLANASSSSVRKTIAEIFAEEDEIELREHEDDVRVAAESQVAARNPADASQDAEQEVEVPQVSPESLLNPKHISLEALIRKLHTNTGHSSVEQMLRLAHRCKANHEIIQTIKEFKCPICEELKYPASHRKSAMPHADHPNQVVGVDYVQVELKRDEASGKRSEKTLNVLTCVDLATGFAQQIVVQPGQYQLSKSFHQVWTRSYGAPQMIYMDADRRNISREFQAYLEHYGITLLHGAPDSHYQLGQVEIANRVLRNMACRVWQDSNRPPEEVIEVCSSVRNDQLRRCGFSPSQWFLGRDPRHAGMLDDIDQQRNFAAQSQFFQDPSFAAQVLLRETAKKAFQEEHAKDVWRRAVATRTRPMRGPYTQGQLVYMFRKTGRGRLSTRHGNWIGPGKIIGVESSRGSIVPRLVWVSYNGYLYKCSPEGLRPMAEDEHEFRSMAKELSLGSELKDIESSLAKTWNLVHDLTQHVPTDKDFELQEDVEAEPDPEGIEDHDLEGAPRKIRRRIQRSPEYWEQRSQGLPPLGPIHEGPASNSVPIDQPRPPVSPEDENPEKRRRVDFDDVPDLMEYTPSIAPDSPMSSHPIDEDMPEERDDIANENVESEVEPVLPEPVPLPVPASEPETTDTLTPETEDVPMSGVDVPVPETDELFAGKNKSKINTRKNNRKVEQVFELSFDIFPQDITSNPLCLWSAFEECFAVTPGKAKQRRVEVNFRKLSEEDKALFEKAMQKEWQSWIDNRVTSLCKAKGIPLDRIIKARWVLVWKKSSDPDEKNKTPKARLVLVGWQDPDLGKVATDSPTLRKRTKHLILSVCAANAWKLWGADIKTAFLSGDASCRDLFFRPPAEIRKWMNLSPDDLFRLEKAAYGLAEAPKAWFTRLTRELLAVGLTQSQLDPCLFMLRGNDGSLIGVCGVHVDDLIGGGCPEMDNVLVELKKRLPFGDYRTYTIRYTGLEVRQDPSTLQIEVGQESYVEALSEVSTKPLGIASTPLQDKSILRTCSGQLAWVSNSTRPDQAFLASYLQGV